MFFLIPLLLMLFAYSRIFYTIFFSGIYRESVRKTRSLSVNQRITLTNLDNRRHYKRTIITSFIIVGTYAICYTPNVTYLALSCIDGCPFPLHLQSPLIRIIVGALSFALIIVKSIVDPFIYSYRMKEVKYAIKSFFNLKQSTNLDDSNCREVCLSTLNGQHPKTATRSSTNIDAQEQYL